MTTAIAGLTLAKFGPKSLELRQESRNRVTHTDSNRMCKGHNHSGGHREHNENTPMNTVESVIETDSQVCTVEERP